MSSTFNTHGTAVTLTRTERIGDLENVTTVIVSHASPYVAAEVAADLLRKTTDPATESSKKESAPCLA